MALLGGRDEGREEGGTNQPIPPEYLRLHLTYDDDAFCTSRTSDKVIHQQSDSGRAVGKIPYLALYTQRSCSGLGLFHVIRLS